MTARTRLQAMRPFTTRVVNPILRRVAGRLPWFGVIVDRGRRTGREYRRPLNVFRRGDSYVFALTYGSDTQWVKNVLAAGSCDLVTRGRTVRLVEPELVHDPSRRLMPPPVRLILAIDDVTEFHRMHAAEVRITTRRLRATGR